MGLFGCRTFILVLFLIFGIACAHGIARRDTGSDSTYDANSMIENIPYLKRIIINISNYICKMISRMQLIRDKHLGPALENVLPCTVTSKSLQCEGIDKRGGMANWTMKLLESNTRVPEFVKPVVRVSISNIASMMSACANNNN